MERDGFCRIVTSKLNYFLPRDTKGQEKKLCVFFSGVQDPDFGDQSGRKLGIFGFGLDIVLSSTGSGTGLSK